MHTDHVARIHQQLHAYQSAGKRVFVSSSFQTHSIPLLHVIATYDAGIPVYFLETGFHFPETLRFRDEIAERLNLNLVNVESPVPKIAQRDARGHFLYTSDPDRCCYLNKVLPLEPVLQAHDVWISGVRRDQTKFRRDLREEEPGAFDTIRYHPILDWTSKMIWAYRQEHDLPEHPLEAQGYLTIGCVPCTRKFTDAPGDREARWAGMTKEECGIHTEFTVK
ncbi:MAG: phosphoadenylyl-sulfate reductase [Saprospiraceae bacterium]|nr:phosphoadenylyl-sulfate reductase [Saprospiraceae bacterium]